MKNLQHFKKTEIGLIPNDWELKKFSEIFSFLSTGTYSRAQIHEEGDVGYLHYGDIHTKLDFKVDTSKYVSGFVSETEGKPYARIRQGDLIIADASEDVNGIGKSIEVMNQPANKVISGLHTFLARDIRNTFAFGFKGYIDSNLLIKKQYIKLASGLKVYSLSKANFDKIWLPVPPFDEQQKIAQALTDADNYISALEKLIEKKKMMKEGLMVNLLTGKQRLKEFAFNEDGTEKGYKDSELGKIPVDWEVKKIGEICDVIRGASPRPKGDKRYYGGNIPRLMVEDVTRDGKFVTPKVDFLTEEGAKLSRPCPKGTLTLVCSGTVGVPSILNVDACIHDGFLALSKVSNKISIDYLYHFFCTQQAKFDNSATHGGVFTNLTTDGVKIFEISLPTSYDEQLKIANILSETDIEINGLNAKLTKLNNIKQGMMQKLLTGEIRLA